MSDHCFVLCTGRSGSRSLAAALRWTENWTVGHESNKRRYFGRLAYPKHHIEVDNRLAWFLGSLARHYSDAHWVHLVRDPDDTAASFARTSFGGDAGIMPAFAGRVIVGSPDPDDRLAACRLYVDTVTDNIAEFLSHRPHTRIRLEEPDEGLELLWDRIDADGPLEQAKREIRNRVA